MLKKKTFWLGFGLAGAALGMSLVRRRRQAARLRWDHALSARPDRVALVTGASSGIGEVYAYRLAALGFNLILVARREERLKAIANDLGRNFGIDAEVLPADLSTSAGIQKVEKRIAERGVDFLLNNAGYNTYSDFVDMPVKQTLGMISVHDLASVRLARAALPGMLERRFGAIVNVASLGAFIPRAKSVTYSAAKAYLNTFSEALALELRGSGVRVQSLCPGFTRTGFHDSPDFTAHRFKESIPAWLWDTPQHVVDTSLQALSENRLLCVPGAVNQAVAVVGRSGLANIPYAIYESFLPKKGAHAMQASSLARLACPVCGGDLSLVGDLGSGVLTCESCGKAYPIDNGIPQFAGYEELNGLNRRFARMYDWFSYVYRPFSKVAFAFIGASEDEMRAEYLDRLELNGGRVLEVSIGPGVNLPYLVGRPGVGEIYGLDISQGQLRRCQDYAGRRAWDVELFQGNAESLPFKDETFDCVFHIGGINFFNDKKKAIEEMIRVAKPGTRIVIGDETERGARGYELTLPGFKGSFKEKRETVAPPVDLVPPEMQEVDLNTNVWRGWFYRLEFRKPAR